MAIQPEVLVKIPGHDIPEPIDLESISGRREFEVTDSRGSEYGVYRFESPTENNSDFFNITEDIAKWLWYRTFTENIVAAEHEADRYRFKDVVEIENKFLIDKGGRDLYVAIDDEYRRLYGVAWFRTIYKDDEEDFQLVNAAYEHLEVIDRAVVPGEHVDTIAAREYGAAVKSALELNLAGLALNDHFARKPNCKGVIGRFGSKDTLVQEMTDTEGRLPGDYSFKEVRNGPGWVMLMATRDNQEETSQLHDDTL